MSRYTVMKSEGCSGTDCTIYSTACSSMYTSIMKFRLPIQNTGSNLVVTSEYIYMGLKLRLGNMSSDILSKITLQAIIQSLSAKGRTVGFLTVELELCSSKNPLVHFHLRSSTSIKYTRIIS